MSPCPRCKRGNAPHRTACLYCGAVMPSPTAPPPRTERPLPGNLDDLVRRAMRGGGVEALRRALETRPEPPVEGTSPDDGPSAPPAPQAAPETVAPPVSAASPPGTAASPPSVAPPPVAPVLSPNAEARPKELPELLLELAAVASRAPQAFPQELPQLLRQMESLLQDARGKLPVAPLRVPVLPPIHLPFMLLAEAADAEVLAAGLQIDMVTARGLAVSRTPRVALRSASREELQRRASRAQGLRLRVIHREELLTIPPAYAVLGAGAPATWKLTGEPLWEDPPEPGSVPPELVLPWESVVRAVPGEVGTYRQRGQREATRWERSRYSSAGAPVERRFGVVDLHTAHGIFRLVEGMTVWEGIPGAEPGSARLSMKAFLEVLEGRGVTVFPRRVCSPVAGQVGEDGAVNGSGWPIWEEHSRVCWLMSLPEGVSKEGSDLAPPA